MPRLRPLLLGVAVLLPLLLLIYLLQDYLDAYLQRDAQVMACDINLERPPHRRRHTQCLSHILPGIR